ncbi:MAG: 50S ribosomal protein L5 [Candidatus Berkelbacteria bacterium]
MPNLKKNFEEKIIPVLMSELGIKNKMAAPKLQKVVVNVGIGGNKVNPKLTETVRANIQAITGQTPVVRRARKAISGFKVRTGDEVGLMVTLRGEKMHEFIQKIAHVTLPRLRDFRGLDPKSFDKAGNFTLGFKEQLIFPEITTEKSEFVHGLEVTMIINSQSAEKSRKLLESLGFPFKKEQNG